MPESIQEYLVKQKFQECPDQEAMVGEDANGDTIVIPYREFAGHTTRSFMEKLKRDGRINADGSTRVVEKAPEQTEILVKWLRGRILFSKEMQLASATSASRVTH